MKNQLIERMIKDKNLSYWSINNLSEYIKKPINLDENFNLVKGNIEYTEEESDAIDSCTAMEKGMFRG